MKNRLERSGRSPVPASRLPLAQTILLIYLLPLVPLLAQSPEHPAITRSVTGIESQAYDRPHLPPFKTSADGRIALSLKSLGGGRNFYLLEPESLADHFANTADGVTILDLSSPYNVSSSSFTGQGTIVHTGLWDPSEVPGATPNPYSVGDGKDYYDLVVVSSARWNDGVDDYIRLWKTPILVTVANPKTDQAYIESIQTFTPVGSPSFRASSMFEVQVSNDGKFVIGRIAFGSHTWTDPVTQISHGPRYADIVYSYSETGDPADWDAVIPIAHAPYDTRINNEYGFAMQPFRDSEGNVIPDNTDIKGTYPWVSRDGNMIGFTAVGSRLHDGTGGRYPNTPIPGQADDTTGEAGGKTRGQIIMGLWTQGKMVMMDNLLNNTDFGLGVGDDKHRMVELYEPNTGPLGNETGIIRVGSGRQANGSNWPANSSTNTTFFDSLENLFNYDGNLKQRSPFDVVWRVSNGKMTDELPFDDYVDLDGFIVSHMSGALTFGTASTGNATMAYHDGWDTSTDTFSLPVKYENAACATSSRWTIPASGLGFGNVRVEPVALGGVHGKGAWMDGSSGIEYAIASQPQDVSESDWYVGAFVDCRFSDDGSDRMLFGFPDQTAVYLRGRSHVVYRNAGGSDVSIIQLPNALPDTGWSHLAVQVLNGGYEVQFFLNGFLYHRWTHPIENLFQMTPGTLSVAKINGGGESGFRGWLDDFKVFAHAMNPETTANQAGGTIVGFNSGGGGSLATQASLYPVWAHDALSAFLASQGQPTYDFYANWHDYTVDDGAHLLNIPAGTTGVRENILFPEGPLFHDAPRPQSIQNAFCLTCHDSSSLEGLSTDALTLDISENAAQDFRRQPSQPLPVISGNIPANWIPGSPSSFTDLGATGAWFDPWLLDSLGSHTCEVVSFSLVDSASGVELMEITDGSVLDVSLLGNGDVNIVANVNASQGSVVFNYDGSSGYQISDAPPYALFDVAEVLLFGELGGGSHTLTARPYTQLNGGGTAGIAKTVTFTVADLVAVTQADYRGDFQTGTPASGWVYMTNLNGSIGTAANYVALPAGPSNNYVEPVTTAERFLNGGRPGWGTGQGQSEDRYSIAGYTVTLEGAYYLGNTYIEQVNKNGGNGTNIKILIDDNEIYSFDNPAKESSTFDIDLGWVKSGQTIYVAVGPKGNKGHDLYHMTYVLAHADLTVVADYQDDFQGVSPKKGWQYLWNANGPVNDETSYISMNWDGDNLYDSDAVDGLPDATELDWGRFLATQVCPGDGADGSIEYDRCAIAAYSVTVSGDYYIADSVLTQLRTAGDGCEVFVLVNGVEKHHVVNIANGTIDFDCGLGHLQAGDTIYVAVGPKANNGSDLATLDYSILVDPD